MDTIVMIDFIAGYMITETDVQPAADDPRWQDTPPTSYVAAHTGATTLYPWVKSTTGEVSTAVAPVQLTVDAVNTAVEPQVTAFTASTPVGFRLVSIDSFTSVAGDNPVSAYAITESAIPPSTYDSRWRSVQPTEYECSKRGSVTLYPWVKDSSGLVSDTATPATVIIPAAPTPLFEGFTPGPTALPWTSNVGVWSGSLPVGSMLGAGRVDGNSLKVETDAVSEPVSITLTFHADTPGILDFWFRVVKTNQNYTTTFTLYINDAVDFQMSYLGAGGWPGDWTQRQGRKYPAGTNTFRFEVKGWEGKILLDDFYMRPMI